MKRLLLILAAGVILAACGGTATQEQHAEERIEDFQIRTLVENPMDYEGNTVRFEGILDHMCQHSGDKMRVAQMDDSEFSIRVMLGDYMNQFNPEMEGHEMTIIGTMHTEVLNMEELEAHDDHDHDCESTEEAIAMMEARGIDPTIRPYIRLQGFEVR